jgi:hypothetical protein
MLFFAFETSFVALEFFVFFLEVLNNLVANDKANERSAIGHC